MGFGTLSGSVISKTIPEQIRTAVNERCSAIGLSTVPAVSATTRSDAHKELVNDLRNRISSAGGRTLIRDNITLRKSEFLTSGNAPYASESALLTAAGHSGGWISLSDLPIGDPSPWQQLIDVLGELKHYRFRVDPSVGNVSWRQFAVDDGTTVTAAMRTCLWGKSVANTPSGSCDGGAVQDDGDDASGTVVLWQEDNPTSTTLVNRYPNSLQHALTYDLSGVTGDLVFVKVKVVAFVGLDPPANDLSYTLSPGTGSGTLNTSSGSDENEHNVLGTLTEASGQVIAVAFDVDDMSGYPWDSSAGGTGFIKYVHGELKALEDISNVYADIDPALTYG